MRSCQLHPLMLLDGMVYLTTRARVWAAPGVCSGDVDLLMASLVALRQAEPPARFVWNPF